MQSITYKAVKYIRLSSADDKQGESDSVANQRKLIDEFLKNHPEIEEDSERVEIITSYLIQLHFGGSLSILWKNLRKQGLLRSTLDRRSPCFLCGNYMPSSFALPPTLILFEKCTPLYSENGLWLKGSKLWLKSMAMVKRFISAELRSENSPLLCAKF